MVDKKEGILTCPECGNCDPLTIMILFPENLFLHRLKEMIPTAVQTKVKPLSKELGLRGRLPNLFLCLSCTNPFRVNKNGREYVSRFSLLCCPSCGFNILGAFRASSRDHDTRLPSRSKGFRKIWFYVDNNFPNQFTCPNCDAKFFLDEDGVEST